MAHLHSKTPSNCYFSLLLGVKSDIMSSQQPFNVISNDQQSSSLHCSSRGRDLQIICPSANGEVQHIQKLSDHIGALFLNDEYSDVSLVVEGQSFRAHKVILAARSGKQCRIILLFTYALTNLVSNFVKIIETSFQNIFEPCYMEE